MFVCSPSGSLSNCYIELRQARLVLGFFCINIGCKVTRVQRPYHEEFYLPVV